MGGQTLTTEAGTATSTGTTSLTNTGAAFGTTKYVGMWVVTPTRYAKILSHTGTVLTVDRWYDPAAPGGAAGSTPSGTTTYLIVPGGLPAAYMALTANNGAPAAGDTTLTGEITTAGGGLIRKICVYAHTAAAASYTLTAVFTANGSDSLPVTVAKMGIFDSMVSGDMVFETLLNATATFTISGDQTTVTETVST
jgi:hypothetical protein